MVLNWLPRRRAEAEEHCILHKMGVQVNKSQVSPAAIRLPCMLDTRPQLYLPCKTHRYGQTQIYDQLTCTDTTAVQTIFCTLKLCGGYLFRNQPWQFCYQAPSLKRSCQLLLSLMFWAAAATPLQSCCSLNQSCCSLNWSASCHSTVQSCVPQGRLAGDVTHTKETPRPQSADSSDVLRHQRCL